MNLHWLLLTFCMFNHCQIDKNTAVVNQLPHDPNQFTEGLFFDGDDLYESAGLYNRSNIRKYHLGPDGLKETKTVSVPSSYFGEGIALVDHKLYQMTWKEKTIFVYDQDLNYKNKKEWSIHQELWGLTSQDNHFYLSDGTSSITKMDFKKDNWNILNMNKIEMHKVTMNILGQNIELPMLNELEYVNGKLLANIYTEDYIAVIDASTYKVEKIIDLSFLRKGLNSKAQELNGIAYKDGKIWITGKFWNKFFIFDEKTFLNPK